MKIERSSVRDPSNAGGIENWRIIAETFFLPFCNAFLPLGVRSNGSLRASLASVPRLKKPLRMSDDTSCAMDGAVEYMRIRALPAVMPGLCSIMRINVNSATVMPGDRNASSAIFWVAEHALCSARKNSSWPVGPVREGDMVMMLVKLTN